MGLALAVDWVGDEEIGVGPTSGIGVPVGLSDGPPQPAANPNVRLVMVIVRNHFFFSVPWTGCVVHTNMATPIFHN